MNKVLVVVCLFLATIAVAGPSILQVYQGGTGANTGAQALINLIGGSPTVGQALTWNGSAWIPGTSGGSSSFDPNNVAIYDEFLGGATTQALGWQSNAGGGSVVIQPNAASGTNHQGIVEVSATTSATTWAYYILGSNNGADDFNPQGQTFKWYFRANNQAGGSGAIRVGLFSNRGIQNPAGAYFESGTAQANTNWWCMQNNSGTITSADSGITAPTGTYHTLEMDASATTTVVWKIDGTQVCNSIGGTNLLNQLLTIAVEASSTGTAPKVWLDYFRLDLTTTGR
jgi:hypothetical protein